MCWIDEYALVRIRLVVHRQDDAGDRLHEERRQRRRAERLHPADVVRDLAEEEPLRVADEAGAVLDPVDRGEGDGLDLLRRADLAIAQEPGVGIGYIQDSQPSTGVPGYW